MEGGREKDDVRNGNDFRHLLDRDRQRTAEERVNRWPMQRRRGTRRIRGKTEEVPEIGANFCMGETHTHAAEAAVNDEVGKSNFTTGRRRRRRSGEREGGVRKRNNKIKRRRRGSARRHRRSDGGQAEN